MGDANTLTSHSLQGSPPQPAAEQPVAQLFVALQCERPLAGTSRHVLDGIQTVHLRRGATLAARRETTRLIIDIPDARMSGEHARLTCVRGGWVIEDAGSKNGTGLNGVAVKKDALSDGNV